MHRIKWSFIFSFLLLASCYHGHGLSPPGNISGIEGKVVFIGEWPDNTKEVWVVVLKEYPKDITDEAELFQFVLNNFVDSTAIPLSVDQHDYQIILDPGVYGWILVAWFPNIDIWFLGVKELGAYYINPEFQTIPTPIEVEEGVLIGGIDIVANFANINRELPFFKPRGKP